MSDISIGIIGTGMMGQEHIVNFNLLPDVRVTALADTDAAMRDKAAALLSDDSARLLSPMILNNCLAMTAPTRWSLRRRIFTILTSGLGAGSGQADIVRKTALHKS